MLSSGFISRSVAGSYDNEAVAIFALLLAFYMFVRAVKTGSMLWAAATAIGYFYMVAAWGGYICIRFFFLSPLRFFPSLQTVMTTRRYYKLVTPVHPRDGVVWQILGQAVHCLLCRLRIGYFDVHAGMLEGKRMDAED
jgi:hypothetical protein